MPGGGGHRAAGKSKKTLTKQKKALPQSSGGGNDGGDGGEGSDASKLNPPPTPGGVWIDADVQVNRICEVNSREQDFTLIFSLTLHWVDERIPEMPDLPESEKELEESIWKPSFYIPGAP